MRNTETLPPLTGLHGSLELSLECALEVTEECGYDGFKALTINVIKGSEVVAVDVQNTEDGAVRKTAQRQHNF